MNGILKTTVILFTLTTLFCSNRDEAIERITYKLPESATHVLHKKFQVEEPKEGYFFKRFIQTELLSNGNLVIWEPFRQNIFELDINGKFVNEIGRQGRGPGEFQSIFRVLATPDDHLFIFDLWNARLERMEKKNGVWESTFNRTFEYKKSALVHQVPYSLVDFTDNGYKALFKISPTESTSDTLSKVYSYYSDVDSLLIPIGRARNYRIKQNMIVSKNQKENSFVTNPRVLTGFYFFEKNTDQIIYFTNSANELIAIDSTDKEKVKGFLPFNQFPIRKNEIDKSLEKLSDYNVEQARSVEKIILSHEPYYKNAIISQDHIWLEISREDSLKPNWLVVTLSGDVIKSFRGPKKFEAQQVWNNRLYGVKRENNGALYLVGYELGKIDN